MGADGTSRSGLHNAGSDSQPGCKRGSTADTECRKGQTDQQRDSGSTSAAGVIARSPGNGDGRSGGFSTSMLKSLGRHREAAWWTSDLRGSLLARVSIVVS